MTTFRYNGKILDFSEPRVMGILNLTPDSFYDGGRYADINEVQKAAAEMLESGAYILDLGAVSTRPGAYPVSHAEERKRLVPVLESLRKEFPGAILSIDTYRSEIARQSVEAGADIINDISGGNMDGAMIPLIERLGVPYILMHMQGTPETMQINPSYEDVVAEVKGFLEYRARHISASGNRNMIIDPGFGFGKTVLQNYHLLDRLGEFTALGFPVLAGLSRKSMINRVLNISPDQALNGTSALNMIALDRGASILRVHDVAPAVETVKLFLALKGSRGQ